MDKANHKPTTIYADDDTESVRLLLRLRIPPLVIGLFLGLGISLLTSKFEEVLTSRVHVAFFIPFIVYIADAIGTQTQTIYARDLRSGHAKFSTYLLKESALGIILGSLFGLICYGVIILWLKDSLLALSVGVAVASVVVVAPLIALVVTEFLNDLHEDPAVGSGPITTVIQDAISIFLYGTIVTSILL